MEKGELMHIFEELMFWNRKDEPPDQPPQQPGEPDEPEKEPEEEPEEVHKSFA